MFTKPLTVSDYNSAYKAVSIETEFLKYVTNGKTDQSYVEKSI